MAEQTSISNKPADWSDGVFGSFPEFDLVPEDTAFVVVDMQYADAHRDYGMGAEAKKLGVEKEYAYYFDRIEDVVVPNIQKLQRACRQHGIEVVHLRIASLVKDCRDVTQIHKWMRLLIPAGSKEAEILEELKPLENEVVVTKGCSGVFNGTAFDQILSNMGLKNLIFAGVATNFCVETSVRDAGDRGYNCILVGDGCASLSPELDRFALELLDDTYCKVKTADEVIQLIETREKRLTTEPVAKTSSQEVRATTGAQ